MHASAVTIDALQMSTSVLVFPLLTSTEFADGPPILWYTSRTNAVGTRKIETGQG